MKSTIHNRAARCITSALLGSTLSERELDEIAEEFLNGGKTPRQIGRTIKEFLAAAENSTRGSKKQPSEENVKSTGHPLVDEALDIIKKRRLSKVSVVKKMGIINSRAFEHFMGHIEMPATAMLMEFFKNETRDRGIAFLELLDGPTSKDDEYLKGIMREKR